MAKIKIHPQWVYQGNDTEKCIKHVSEFKGVKPRPSVCCPECNELVVLALGKKNVDHYRHTPESTCSLKGGRESIMHSNVKFHIRNELSKGSKLIVRQKCKGYGVRACDEFVEKVAFEGWDTSIVEYRIDKYFADVGVTAKGSPVGVIEVWVNHETTGEKEEFLSHNIPWIEVKVTDDNYSDVMVWTIDQALPITVSKIGGKDDFYTCIKCKKREQNKLSDSKKEVIFNARVAGLETLPSRIECLGVRDIDLTFYSGKTYRKYLLLYADWRGPTLLRTWMQFKGETEKLYPLTLPNGMNHVKNFYRHKIMGTFSMVDMSIIAYSCHAASFYIHDARRVGSPEPPRFTPKGRDK